MVLTLLFVIAGHNNAVLQAGLPQAAVVAAHGNFDRAHCIKCGKEHSLEYVKQAVFSDSICHCTKCG